MPSEVQGIVDRYRRTNQVHTLANNLFRIKEKTDITEYWQDILKAAKQSATLYNFLLKDELFYIITEHGEVNFSEYIRETLGSDIKYVLDLASRECIDFDAVASCQLVEQHVQKLEDGDVSGILDFIAKDESNAQAFLSSLAEILIDAATVFYDKTGNIQLFRFLVKYASDQDRIVALIQKAVPGLEFLKDQGRYVLPIDLALVIALPNAKLFDLAMANISVTTRGIVDARAVDVFKGMALSDIFDYLAVAPIDVKERERRAEKLFAAFPSIQNDLLKYQQLRYSGEAEAKSLDRQRMNIGFESRVFTEDGYTITMSNLVYNAILKGEPLGDRFINYWRESRNTQAMSPNDKIVFKAICAYRFDAQGMVSFLEPIPGLSEDRALESCQSGVQPQFNIYKARFFTITKRTLVAKLLSALDRLTFAVKRYPNESKDMVARGIKLLQEKRDELLERDYYSYMLKLAMLDGKACPITLGEFHGDLDTHRDWYDVEALNYVRYHYALEAVPVKKDSENNEWFTLRVGYAVATLLSLGLAIFFGIDPLSVVKEQARIVFAVLFGISAVVCAYYAICNPKPNMSNTPAPSRVTGPGDLVRPFGVFSVQGGGPEAGPTYG